MRGWDYSARLGVARSANVKKRRPAAIVKTWLLFLALTLPAAVVFVVSAAFATERTEQTPFEFLVVTITDAEDKGLLSEELKNLLARQLVEILIVPVFGETADEVETRLSVTGQTTFQFLIAILADAHDREILSDELSDTLSDWFIDTLIAPHTDETPEQAADRLADLSVSIPVITSYATDREVLIRLYHATDGPNWTRSENWLSDKPLDQWYGVKTSYGGERVYGLALIDNQLNGPIPPEIGRLTRLRHMNLSENKLSGPIPPEIGKLADLEELRLWGNELSGPIPPEIGKLTTRLWRLDLAGNKLSGPIPPEIGNLTGLLILNLSVNKLSGPIPPELGKPPYIYIITLRMNEFTGCMPIDPRQVDQIFVDPNILFCAEKDALTALYNATDGPNWIDNTNWLSDKPIGEWYGIDTDWFGRISYLELGGNNLNGPIPPELGNLEKLWWLDLSQNELSGDIPPELGNLIGLSWLDLSQNELSGDIPPEIGNLIGLSRLYLSQNDLRGDIPPEIGNLANLGWLYLSENELSGEIPPEIGNLIGLSRLDLSQNDLSGEIPPEIGKITKLWRLYLSGNALSGPIPPEIGNLTNLDLLHLADNKLSGDIPPELGYLAKLTYLALWENELTGCLPINLSHIQEVFVDPNILFCAHKDELIALYDATDGPDWIDSANWLSDKPVGEWRGVITDEYGRIIGLDLGGNNLNGRIPPELGDLTYLESLSLYDNELSGQVPPELGQLSGLKELLLHGNRLAGPLPPELGDLTALRRLFIGGNPLFECIPDSLGSVPYNDLSILGMPLCASGTPPSPPYTDVAAFSISPTQISLTWWCGIRDKSSRQIYRNGEFVASTPPGDCSYTDEELDPNTKYLYQVEFHDADGSVNIAQAVVATLAYPPKTYFPLNITDSGFKLAIVNELNPPETEYRVEISLPPPIPSPEPTATPGPPPSDTRIVERDDDAARRMFVAPQWPLADTHRPPSVAIGDVERLDRMAGRVFIDRQSPYPDALHPQSRVAIQFGRVYDGSKSVASDWDTSRCLTLENLQSPLTEVEVISRNVDGVETTGSSLEDGFPGPRYFFLQELTGNDDPWAIARIKDAAAIYNLTESARHWMVSDIHVEGMRNEPGYAGYRGPTGAGIGYPVGPGTLMHEVMHGYWEHWDGFSDPCDVMNLYAFRRDVAQFMFDFREYDPSPWGEWRPFYDYLIGISGNYISSDDIDFWELLSQGEYDELWGGLYHLVDTEIPSITAGKLSLIPPPLRPYFEGFISDGEDNTTWHDELLWYINLPYQERRLWDTAYKYNSVIAHSGRYYLPDGRVSEIPSDTRKLLRDADRRILVDFINTLEDISCNTQDPCQELWNADFYFWTRYVDENLYRSSLYLDELAPSVGIELEQSNWEAVQEALRILATDASECGETYASALHGPVNSIEGVTDLQRAAFLAMIEVRELNGHWNPPCLR